VLLLNVKQIVLSMHEILRNPPMLALELAFFALLSGQIAKLTLAKASPVTGICLARLSLAEHTQTRSASPLFEKEYPMKIQDIMSAEPSTVTPDTPITEAARLMKDHNVGMLPVVESQDSPRLIGVVTDRDITIRHVAEGHLRDCPVREAMTDNVLTCTADDNVEQAMSLMANEQVRRIPIVDERGYLVGVVSQADIVLEAGDDQKAEQTIERISRPYGKHSD
jgi:CBS domain-containing protein